MARAKTIKKADSKISEPAAKKRGDKERVAQGAPREYSINETYEEGDFVYHKMWDDTGEVIEIGTTEDGIRKMKVNFDKVGMKSLRMGQPAA